MAEKLPEIITEEEMQKILDATKDPKKKLAFALGFYECLRVSEVACLEPEHVQKQTRLLF